MPNPDGTYTREEHRAAIVALYLDNRRNGMDEEAAMRKAGETWRAAIKEKADVDIARVKAFLGLK